MNIDKPYKNYATDLDEKTAEQFETCMNQPIEDLRKHVETEEGDRKDAGQ